MVETASNYTVLLAGRAYGYRFFQKTFGEEPTREMIDEVRSDAAQDALALFHTIADKQYVEFRELLHHRYRETDDTVLADLKREYLMLFIGPGSLEAPPWESVHINRERLLFQPSTLEVRQAYRKEGYVPADYPHVADDHIALELDFMAKLAALTTRAYETGDLYEAQRLVSAQLSFLDEHLLIWVRLWSASLYGIEGCRFYPLLAELLLRTMRVDRSLLDELRSALAPSMP